MAKYKNIEVKDLSLFENNWIVLHVPSQRLYALPLAELRKIYRKENVLNAKELGKEYLLKFKMFAPDKKSLSSFSHELKLGELEEIGYKYESQRKLVTFFSISLFS
jgi:hypothetical protein